MSAPHPAPDAPEPSADPMVVKAELRVTKLQRLSDKGLGVAEATPEDGSAESAEVFAKTSRAVRLTITLEAKLDEALRAYLAGETVKAEARKAEVAKDAFAPLRTGRKARARDLLIDVIDREIPDPEDRDVLIDALDERLLCDEAYRLIDDLPLRDIVERLCADLKLKPDWKLWAGEGWTPNPPFTRPRCSDFKTPSRKPILADLSGPDPWD